MPFADVCWIGLFHNYFYCADEGFSAHCIVRECRPSSMADAHLIVFTVQLKRNDTSLFYCSALVERTHQNRFLIDEN